MAPGLQCRLNAGANVVSIQEKPYVTFWIWIFSRRAVPDRHSFVMLGGNRELHRPVGHRITKVTNWYSTVMHHITMFWSTMGHTYVMVVSVDYKQKVCLWCWKAGTDFCVEFPVISGCLSRRGGSACRLPVMCTHFSPLHLPFSLFPPSLFLPLSPPLSLFWFLISGLVSGSLLSLPSLPPPDVCFLAQSLFLHSPPPIPKAHIYIVFRTVFLLYPFKKTVQKVMWMCLSYVYIDRCRGITVATVLGTVTCCTD